MKKQLFSIFFSLFILGGNIFSATIEELTSILASNSSTLQYYFFPSPETNTYFLAKNRDSGASMWQFTSEKKWKPTHNAGAFDGFPEAIDVFQSLALANGKVNIGAVVGSSSDALINELQGKSIDATHYFWVVAENSTSYAFLAKNGNQGASIYHLTSEKKWQPVHNAGAFDGFPEAGTTIQGVSIDLADEKIITGASVSNTGANTGTSALENGQDGNYGYELLKTLSGHDSYIWTVNISKDGQYIVSGSRDNSIKIWDVTKGDVASSMNSHSDYVYSVAISNDNKYIVSGSADKSIKIHNKDKDSSTNKITTSLLSTLDGHTYGINSVAITNDNKKIISASDDKTVKIWDLSGGTVLKTLNAHVRSVRSVAISSDDKYMASAGDDETIRIWDLSSYTQISILGGHTGGTITLDISKDGKYVVSGGSDNLIKIWNIGGGGAIKTLSGHSQPIKSVAISNDGTRIVSGSMDRTIKVWDASTGELLGTIAGHSSIVNAVAISDDNKKIISGSQDRTIKIWKMK